MDVPDLVWQNDTTRAVTVWYMGGAQGATFQGWNYLSGGAAGWKVVGAADFNGDGVPDLIWQNDTRGRSPCGTWAAHREPPSRAGII